MSQAGVSTFRQFALCFGAFGLLTLPAEAVNNPAVIHAVRQDVSAVLRDMASAAPENAAAQSQHVMVARPTRPVLTDSRPDPVAQQLTRQLSGLTTLLNFDGQNANDTLNLLGSKFVPPDTNGAVGSSQFVQIVNVTLAVYDKKTGAKVLGPALISSVWKGFGGPCEAWNGGAPIAPYHARAG